MIFKKMTFKKWLTLKNFYIVFFLFLIPFTAGYFISYHWLSIKDFVFDKVTSLSEKHLSVVVLPHKISINPYPLGLKFEEIQIKPQKEFNKFVKTLKVDSVLITPNYFSLILLKPKISNVYLKLSRLKVELPRPLPAVSSSAVSLLPPAGSKSSLSSLSSLEALVEKYSKTIQKIPIDALNVETQFLELNQGQKKIKATSNHFSIYKRFSYLNFRINAPQIKYHSAEDDVRLNFGLKLSAKLLPKKLELDILNITSPDNELNLIGKIESPFKSFGTLKDISGDIKLKSSLNLLKLQPVLQNIFPQKEIPLMDGTSSLSANLIFKKNKLISDFNVQTKNIKISRFQIGNLNVSGDIKNKKLSFTKLQVQNSAGAIEFKKALFNMQSPYSFSIQPHIKQLEFKKLMNNLGLPRVQVYFNSVGEFPCQGFLKPSIFVRCEGTLLNNDFDIQTVSNSTIIKFPKMNAKGFFEVSSQSVKYEAALSMDKSEGQSSGVIDFQKGFEVKYSSKNFDLSDIDNLSGLRFEGVAQINGSSKGESRTAVADLDIDVKKMWLSDYHLGNIKSKIGYEKGFLKLKSITGNINKTQYKGFFNIYTYENTFSSDLNFPYLEAADIKKALSRTLPIAFNIAGAGKGQIKLSGPLHIEKLSYDLKSTFKQNTVSSEDFKSAYFDIKATNGVSRIQTARFQKNKSIIDLKGQLDHKGPIDLKISSNNFQLEDSDVISQLEQNISGRLLGSVHLTGDVRDPDYRFKGKIPSLNVRYDSLEKSSFDFTLTNKKFLGDFNLFSGAVQGQIQHPRDSQIGVHSTPFSVKVNTKNWDYTKLLPFISSSSVAEEYAGRLTSDISLLSPTGDPWKSTGEVKIDKLSVGRGGVMAKNTKQISLILDNGILSIRNFLLDNKQTQIRVVGENVSKDNFKIDLNAKTNIRFFKLFMPFAEELNGLFSISLKTEGSIFSPNFLGSAFIEKTYIKIKKFPNSFENIQSNLLFNDKKIVVSTLQANMGGGLLTGDGKIYLHGSKNFPVDLTLNLKDTSLNIPEGIDTKGSGEIKFSGSWFPYKLQGQYNLDEGLVRDEFLETVQPTVSIEKNPFLPEIKSSQSSVFDLDLKIKTNKPINVKSSQFDGKITGAIHLKQAPEKPLVTGNISVVPKSRLNFRDSFFEISRGFLSFKGRKKINPDIYLEANTRLKEYSIDLEARGTIDSPLISLKSTPSLPEESIATLLTFGTISESLNENQGLSNQALQSTWSLGTTILNQNPITRRIKQQLGVNMEISSSINESNKAVPSATFSKKVGEKTDLSVSINEEKKINFNAHYKINDNLFLKGSVNSQEDSTNNTNSNVNEKDVVGFDIEYKIGFE